MTDEPQSTVVRDKAARVLRLARTVTDERARVTLLDYAQELMEQAEEQERRAADGTPEAAAAARSRD